jgi:uncharacterized membrane protein
MASSLLKAASVITVVCGIGASFWFLFQTDRDSFDKVLTIGGILGSIIAGVFLYAIAEFFLCVMDIESNTRINAKTQNPHA